jgi:O-antigen biosynthesis protein
MGLQPQALQYDGRDRQCKSRRRTGRYAEVDPGRPNTSHAFMLDLVGYNARVLELGCAGGHVTRALARRGCRVTGVEIDPVAGSHAAQSAEEVISADLEDLRWADKLEAEQFDVVVAGDVLEHLRDPLPVLRACRPLLRPSGSLVVSLPNVAHVDVVIALLQGRFDYHEWGLLDETHLRFFTKKSADELLRRAGYIPIETKGVVVPVFETELEIDRDKLNGDLLPRLLEDPEAETYQFVINAVPDNGDAAVREIAERCDRLDQELRRERVRATAAASALRASEERARAAERELAAIHATRIFRYAAPLRRLYRLLRSGV